MFFLLKSLNLSLRWEFFISDHKGKVMFWKRLFVHGGDLPPNGSLPLKGPVCLWRGGLPQGSLPNPLILISSGSNCSGRYAFYWHAFFFSNISSCLITWLIKFKIGKILLAIDLKISTNRTKESWLIKHTYRLLPSLQF